MSEPIITKRCCACKSIKPVADFSKNRSVKDGLCRCCKLCKKASDKFSYQKHKSARNAANKRYRKTERGKAANKRYDQSEKGRATHLKAQRRYWDSRPNYRKATSAVSHAIRDGKLPPANSLQCHYCPKQAEQYHHILGYEPKHALDVEPVCRSCHNKIHIKKPYRSLLSNRAILPSYPILKTI